MPTALRLPSFFVHAALVVYRECFPGVRSTPARELGRLTPVLASRCGSGAAAYGPGAYPYIGGHYTYYCGPHRYAHTRG